MSEIIHVFDSDEEDAGDDTRSLIRSLRAAIDEELEGPAGKIEKLYEESAQHHTGFIPNHGSGPEEGLAGQTSPGLVLHLSVNHLPNLHLHF